MCDRSTGRHFEAVKCKEHSGQSVNLLGGVTGKKGRHLEEISVGNILVKIVDLLSCVKGRQVDILRQ